MSQATPLAPFAIRLHALDNLRESLQADLERLSAALTPIPEDFEERFRELVACVTALRDEVIEFAARAGVATPEWGDRPSLEKVLTELVARSAEREGERRRRRLCLVGEQLQAGRFAHRLPSKLARLEEARGHAVDEMFRAAETPEPPELPDPGRVGDWLGGAWALDADELQQLLVALQERFPALVSLLEDGEPSWWKPAPVASPQESGEPASVGHLPNDTHPVLEHGGLSGAELHGQESPLSTRSACTSATPDAEVAPSIAQEHTHASSLEEAIPDGAAGFTESLQGSEVEPAHKVHPQATTTPVMRPDAAVEEPSPPPESIAVPDVSTGPFAEPDSPFSEAAVRQPEPVSGTSAPTLPATPPPPAIVGARETITPPARNRGPTVIRTLPDNLHTFQAFREAHWVSPRGVCEPAPWRQGGFATRLQEAMMRCAGSARLARLWLLTRAAEILDVPPLFFSGDVESVAACRANPNSLSALQNPARGKLLIQASLDGLAVDAPCWRLALFLEAARPSGEVLLGDEELARLVAAAGYRDHELADFIKQSLALSLRGIDTLERLRHEILAPQPAEVAVQPAEALQQARQALQQQFQKINLNGGYPQGSLPFRRAWARFIRLGEQVWEPLMPGSTVRREQWHPSEMERALHELKDKAENIVEHGGIPQGEREPFRRGVADLLDEALKVIGCMRRLLASHPGTPSAQESVPLPEVHRLLQGRPVSTPEEEMCRHLLRGMLTSDAAPSAQDPLALTLGEFLEFPWLTGLVPGRVWGAVRGGDTAAAQVCRATEVTDPVRAAAVLLSGPREERGPGPALRQLTEQASEFPELLARLSEKLEPPLRAALPRAKLDEARSDAHAAIGEIDHLVRDLRELVSPTAALLDRIADKARELAEDAGFTELTLLRAWLAETVRVGSAMRASEIAALRDRLEGELTGAGRERGLAALDDGRFAEALLHAGGQSPNLDEGRRRRETVWRKQAEVRFERAARLMAEMDHEPTRELRDQWLGGVRGMEGGGPDHKLRTTFARFICSAPPKKSRRKEENLYDRAENRSTCIVLPCAAFREYIAAQGLNPSYLPQLAHFNNLVILTPPCSLEDSGFVQKTARSVAKQGENSCCVVLAPRLGPRGRESLQKVLRERNDLTGAVLDDTDLCRLLNPGGEQPNLLIGLFEIILEQQRRSATAVIPFSMRTGVNVQMEMFVGRKEEADRLCESADYSRLFSGRKLGKSALLRFVEETYDGKELPGGRELHVLMVPAVGPSAREVLFEVLRQMENRLGFRPVVNIQGDPADALVAAVDQFVRDRPAINLLIILDEADSFVDAELEHYQRRKEQCLSFRIRNQIESHRDDRGMPRVRFVFSGYRVTNTSDGVWAHWGEVLRLSPLKPSDADELVAGPLARLGIDLGNQTRVVSWMCGYQPAVLLKFGIELLVHLQARSAEYVAVTKEEVLHVFTQQTVRDEIRTVVRNNFQDNPAAWLVFSALLLQFTELTPGEGIDTPVEQVLEQLSDINPDTSWLRQHEGSERSAIAWLLRDFCDRQLLVERRDSSGGPSTYFLKFPHHLPVLCSQDPADARRRLGEEIQALLRGQPAGASPRVRALLDPDSMEALRSVVRGPATPGSPYRAAVVASLWPQAANHPSFGFPVLLGIDPTWTRPARRVRSVDPTASRLAITDTPSYRAFEILKELPPDRPRPLFTGGVDLLRKALQMDSAGSAQFLVRGIGRLTTAEVEWWFTRVRRLGLPNPSSAIGTVMQLTGGMPSLLQLVDQALGADGKQTQDEETVSEERFRQALDRFAERLPETARRLVDGSAEVRLEPRELELARMIVQVCEEEHHSLKAGDLHLGLTEAWDDLYRAGSAMEAYTEKDQGALLLLEMVGLVPIDANQDPSLPLERLVPVGAEDPLIALLGHAGVVS